MSLFKLHLQKFGSCLLFLLMASFFVQAPNINMGGITAKLFMLVSALFFLVLILKIRVKKIYNHEFFWLVYFFTLMVSSLYASNKFLALKVVIGQFVLIISWVVYRYLLDICSKEIFEKHLIIIGKYFVLASFVMYLTGIYSVFISGNIVVPERTYSSELLNFRCFGLLIESGNFPRLIGLTESPNNYAILANFLFWLLIFKKKTWLATFTFLTFILTLSTSGVVVFVSQIVIYFIVNGGGKNLYVFVLIIILTGLFLYFYESIDFIQKIIDTRINRNSSGTGRLELFKFVWDLIKDSPIIGYGANQSRELTAIFLRPMSAHNSYLEIWLSAGVVGFVLYLCFIASMIRNAFYVYKKTLNPLCLMLTVGFAVFSVTNNTLHTGYSIFILGTLYFYNKKFI